MRILMMTNTFTPHVGGVARSVEAFTASYRKLGHEVLVVAPEFDNMPSEETGVVRVPAIQNFNGSDFSVVLPAPGFLHDAVEAFQPDIVHSHHPFLIGSTALRLARQFSAIRRPSGGSSSISAPVTPTSAITSLRPARPLPRYCAVATSSSRSMWCRRGCR